MTAKKSFRQVLAERRDFEKNSGQRLTDVGGNKPRPMDTRQLVKHLVRTQLSEVAEESGFETFEEADDFEDEDPEPPWTSQFEIHDMQPEEEPFHAPSKDEPPTDPLEGRADTGDDDDAGGVHDPPGENRPE
jgi:hypothetical protein